jgi:hypothetical protein
MYFLLLHVRVKDSCFIYIHHTSHEHTDFGSQIPFLGSYLRQKVYFFLLVVKFPIDATTLILSPKFGFADLGAILVCLTPRSKYFLHLYKISNRLMGHMTYFIFEPHSAQPRDPADFKMFCVFIFLK